MLGRGSVLDRKGKDARSVGGNTDLSDLPDLPKPEARSRGCRQYLLTPEGRMGARRDWIWGVGKEEAPSSSLLALAPGLRPVLPCQPGKQVFEDMTTQELGLSRVCAIVR